MALQMFSNNLVPSYTSFSQCWPFILFFIFGWWSRLHLVHHGVNPKPQPQPKPSATYARSRWCSTDPHGAQPWRLGIGISSGACDKYFNTQARRSARYSNRPICQGSDYMPADAHIRWRSLGQKARPKCWMNVRAETVNEHISLAHAAGELKRHRKMVEKISLQNAVG